MARRLTHLLPSASQALAQLGQRLALARGRRGITKKHMAQRAGLTEFTLRRVEHGEGTVTIASVLAVLQTLGLAADLDRLAAEDALGRDLQDAPFLQKIARQRQPQTRITGVPIFEGTPPKKAVRGTQSTAQGPTPILTTDDIVRLVSESAPEEPPS
jgi:transcriptional regulator with XRE-family HTH domain